jgi:hypothetical protein
VERRKASADSPAARSNQMSNVNTLRGNAQL